MTRVLYIMYGMPSCHNSGLTMAGKFADSELDITVACDQDISELTSKANIPFIHLKQLSKTTTAAQYSSIKAQSSELQLTGYKRIVWLLKQRLALRKSTIENTELLQVIKSANPDVLLIDIECHVAIISSSKLPIPTALCSRLFDHRPGALRPPLHTDLTSDSDVGGRLRTKIAWWRLAYESWLVRLKQTISVNRLQPIHYRTNSIVDIKAIARHHGVKLWSIATTQHWFRPVTYHHVPILSMTLEALDFDRVADDQFIHIGPMINGADHLSQNNAELSQRLDAFIDRAKASKKQLVYCAMGTYAGNEPRFVNAMFGLAQTRDDLAFIVSLGNRENTSNYAAAPSNMLLLESVPQIKCLASADAAILHAGIASLQEALMHRVPLLMFSVGSNDQNGTATRWRELGLAARFSLNTVTPQMLSAEIDQLFADQELPARLEKYQSLAQQSFLNFKPKELIRQLQKT